MSPERIRPGSARTRTGAPATPVEPAPGADEVAPRGAAADAGELASAEPTAPETRAEAPVTDALAPAEETTAGGEDAVPDWAPGPEAPGVPEPAALAPRRRNRPAAVAAARAAAAGAGEDEAQQVPAATGAGKLSWFKKLYFGRTHIDFVRHRRIWFSVSAIIVLAGAISLGVRGLNLSIDFVGGTSWTVPAKNLHVSSTQAVTEARNAVTPLGLGGATITELGVGQNATIEVAAKVTGGNTSVNSQSLRSEVASALGKLVGSGPEAVSITQVGPSWGSQITSKAIEALIVFFILIAIYISIFFEWRMALAAIIAVAHDVMVVVGIYSLSALEVTPDTVVAVLTILGYSLYDTIVVFDRVRDNIRSLGPSNKLTISDLVNLSMNQTLARSVNTSLVAILPILAVLVLGAEVLGATTLEYFGFALLIGLLSGAYSSIFIASPLVAQMKEREQRWRNLRARLVQRGADRLLLSPADIAAGILDESGALRARGERRNAALAGRIGEADEDGLRVPARVASTRPAGRGGAARSSARARRKGGRR